MAIPSRFYPQSQPFTLNQTPYKTAAELYTSDSGNLREGGDNRFRQRNGIAVTVTIPPTLRAFKYPSIAGSRAGTPYLSDADRQSVADRREWYKSASTSLTSKITATKRSIAEVEKALRLARSRNNAAAVARLEIRLARLKNVLSNLTANAKNDDKILDQYSSEFEISDFITSMSWSSTDESGFVNLQIGLDNSHNLFAYLPEGAKVTVWRRKSTTNTNRGNSLYSGKWYRYITSYIVEKSHSFEGRGQTLDIQCADRASFLQSHISSKGAWKKDEKTHKDGWTPRQITIDVCKREGIPYNADKIPSRYPIKKVTKQANGLYRSDVEWVTIPPIEYTAETKEISLLLSKAWNDALAKLPLKKRLPYVIHMRRGVLEVDFVAPPGDPSTQTDEARQRILCVFNDNNIESAGMSESMKPEEVFTVLSAKGTSKKKKKNKNGRTVVEKKQFKGTFTPSMPRGKFILDAYGRRVKSHEFKNTFKNEKEFRQAAQAYIDKISRPTRTLEISGQAPLGIWPNYYVFVSSRRLGVKGNIIVNSVDYSIEDGRINVSLQLNALYKHYSSGEKAFRYSPPESGTWY